MLFRIAKLEDHKIIMAIALKAYEKYIERMGKEPAPMRPIIQKENVVFVYEDNKQVIAFAILVKINDQIILDSIAVDPSHQKKGIGNNFIKFIEQYLIKQKFNKYQLYTNEKMFENIDWYQKIGFKIFKRVTEKAYNRIYFEKELS
ncbi:GNAT family N-acetyltransferase [Candidatus Pelagibacter sp.]|nr:GNAT family N-acetyltransferase [Candidatus Pelagibacter sp.]